MKLFVSSFLSRLLLLLLVLQTPIYGSKYNQQSKQRGIYKRQ